MQDVSKEQHPRIWAGFVAIANEYGSEHHGLEVGLPVLIEIEDKWNLVAIENSLSGLTISQIEGLAVKQGISEQGNFEDWLATRPDLQAADELFDMFSLEWI